MDEIGYCVSKIVNKSFLVAALATPVLMLSLIYDHELNRASSVVASTIHRSVLSITDSNVAVLDGVEQELHHVMDGALYAKSHMWEQVLEKNSPIKWSDYNSITALRSKGFITKPLPHFTEWERGNRSVMTAGKSVIIMSDPVPDCTKWAEASGRPIINAKEEYVAEGSSCMVVSATEFRIVGKKVLFDDNK